MGVDSPTWGSPGVWPTKEELAGQSLDTDELGDLEAFPNYPSAEAHSHDIEATFQEEKLLDMVIGPCTWEEAASVCQCQVQDLVPGPMAAIEESDKIRTIFDGTKGGQNAYIRAHTKERTTSPTVHDAMHALHWCKEAASLSKALEAGSSIDSLMEWDFDGNPPVCHDILHGEPSWVLPRSDEEWIILKADLAKAHRRIKIHPSEWKYQIAVINDNVWINKVGTYGVASAQLYWGRLAAFILRSIYNLYPTVDWGFVYVDDFAWLIRGSIHEPVACAIMLTLVALGCPLSWKKTVMSCTNIWLGFQVLTLETKVILAQSKQVAVTAALRSLIAGDPMDHSQIESMLGRFVWATGSCPQLKPFLQPFFAWKQRMLQVRTSGRPSKLLKMLAAMMLMAICHKHKHPSPFVRASPWKSASDAGAKNDSGERSIGGWFCSSLPSSKGDVYWFSVKITEELYPWAFLKEVPSSNIAALELYASLVTLRLMLERMDPHAKVDYYVPLCTDNQGNAYSILKESSRTWPSSAFLMELFLQAALHGVHLRATHVYREHNEWADALVNGEFKDFDPAKRLDWSPATARWLVLDSLLILGGPLGT